MPRRSSVPSAPTAASPTARRLSGTRIERYLRACTRRARRSLTRRLTLGGERRARGGRATLVRLSERVPDAHTAPLLPVLKWQRRCFYVNRNRQVVQR